MKDVYDNIFPLGDASKYAHLVFKCIDKEDTGNKKFKNDYFLKINFYFSPIFWLIVQQFFTSLQNLDIHFKVALYFKTLKSRNHVGFKTYMF